jgi:anti-sigma regulatory factor (Ser/Thr protein kinase)
LHELANVRLSLLGRPENVLVIRQTLTGLAGLLALDPIETNDLNTAVTEACNNVVMHAYEGAEGSLEVDVHVLVGGLAVVVRDHGIGMDAASIAGLSDGVGMGLAVIGTLATGVSFSQPRDGGTEVRMEFPLPLRHRTTLVPLPDADEPQPVLAQADTTGAVAMQLAPSSLARAILPRVLSALAARAHFTTDRIADVQIVADVLAANAEESVDGCCLEVGVSVSPRNLGLRIGPLHSGRGEGLIEAAADGLAPVVERLTDGMRVAPDGCCETLELLLVDQR